MNEAFRTVGGGRVDRTRPVRFTFDGRVLSGLHGDTLASALLANGVHLVGRSFKYHRPRGILAAGSEEPNALVRAGSAARGTPNLRATQVEIFEGLVAESQNRFPSLRFDFGALAGLVAPLLPAGFYYKTFMWPSWAWTRLYEPAIRAAAGLGRAPAGSDPDLYAQRYVHCDVLVIGAGPAGLSAALQAGRAGARVLVCDEQCEPGGSLLGEHPDGEDGGWLRRTLAELAACPRVKMLPRTTAFGKFAQNFVALAERVTDHLADPDPALPRERLWQVRARQVVLATGAIERPMIFAGNDRPGIMLAGAARSYLHRYGVRAGMRAVIATNDDAAYGVALDLARAGVRIAAIADARTEANGPNAMAARRAGLEMRFGTSIAGTTGRLRVSSALLVGEDARRERIACDLLLMSGGFTPSVHLFSQARGALRFDAALGAYVPDGDTGAMRAAGACNGTMGLTGAIEEGASAGAEAVMRAGLSALPPPRRATTRREEDAVNRAVTPKSHGCAFVDFQNDVTTKDLALAVREGLSRSSM